MSDNISDSVDQAVVPPKDEPSKSVAFETYQRVLAQRKSDQSKFKELEQAHNALVAEKQSAEEAAKAEQGKYQELFEAERAAVEKLQIEISQRQQMDLIRTKEAALAAELKGIRKTEYLKFADINSIVLDESGLVEQESLKQVASSFREQYGDLISTQSDLPDNAPGTGPQSLTYETWLNLSAKEKVARSHEVKD